MGAARLEVDQRRVPATRERVRAGYEAWIAKLEAENDRLKRHLDYVNEEVELFSHSLAETRAERDRLKAELRAERTSRDMGTAQKRRSVTRALPERYETPGREGGQSFLFTEVNMTACKQDEKKVKGGGGGGTDTLVIGDVGCSDEMVGVSAWAGGNNPNYFFVGSDASDWSVVVVSPTELDPTTADKPVLIVRGTQTGLLSGDYLVGTLTIGAAGAYPSGGSPPSIPSDMPITVPNDGQTGSAPNGFTLSGTLNVNWECQFTLPWVDNSDLSEFGYPPAGVVPCTVVISCNASDVPAATLELSLQLPYQT